MLSVFIVKISRMIFFCCIIGFRFLEMVDFWRLVYVIKVIFCKLEIRSRFIYYLSILMVVGFLRFIFIVILGNLFLNEFSV